MNSHAALERCLTFINCQLQSNGAPGGAPSALNAKRAMTISRQAGCDGHSIAEALAECLQSAAPRESKPWAVLDRDLVETVLQHHNLPKRLASFMPEDRVSELADITDELFGLRPSSWILVRKTSETILHLAEVGNVILIGRGANLITRRLNHVFHVRLVGSLESRVERIQKAEHLSKKAALELVRRTDRGRKRYMKKYFAQSIDNPLLYHLVINTDLVPHQKAARIIADAMAVIPNGRELRNSPASS